MQVNVSGRHADLSADVRNYALDRVEHLSKYFDRITNVDVVIDQRRERHLVEMVARVGHGATLVARDENEGLMAALDAAVDKLERQIRKLKGRLRNRRPHHGAVAAAPVESEESEEELFEGEAEFEKEL